MWRLFNGKIGCKNGKFQVRNGENDIILIATNVLNYKFRTFIAIKISYYR